MIKIDCSSRGIIVIVSAFALAASALSCEIASGAFTAANSIAFAQGPIAAGCSVDNFMFYGTATAPGKVLRTTADNTLPSGENLRTLAAGENNVGGAVCPAADEHAYFITASSATVTVVKVCKANNTRVAALPVSASSGVVGPSLLADGTHLFAVTGGTVPGTGKLTKIELATFAVVRQSPADLPNGGFASQTPCLLAATAVVCGGGATDEAIRRYAKSDLAETGMLPTPGSSVFRAAALDPRQSHRHVGYLYANAGTSQGLFKIDVNAMTRMQFQTAAALGVAGVPIFTVVARTDGLALYAGANGVTIEVDLASLTAAGAPADIGDSVHACSRMRLDTVVFCGDAAGNSVEISWLCAADFTESGGSCVKNDGVACGANAECLNNDCRGNTSCCHANIISDPNCAACGANGVCTLCAAGSTMDTVSGVCKKNAGQLCSGDVQCFGGHCLTKCCAPNTEGVCAACASDAGTCTACTAGYSVIAGGSCRLSGGQLCNQSSDCAENICRSACCVGTISPACTMCNNNTGMCSTCAAGYSVGASGDCKKNTGEVCSADTDCLSGKCASGICCAARTHVNCNTCSGSGSNLGACTACSAGFEFSSGSCIAITTTTTVAPPPVPTTTASSPSTTVSLDANAVLAAASYIHDTAWIVGGAIGGLVIVAVLACCLHTYIGRNNQRKRPDKKETRKSEPNS